MSPADGSEGFTDIRANEAGLTPRPARPIDAACFHARVADVSAGAFSAERGHPVFPVKLPSTSVSLSVGELAAGAATSRHRHAYESLVYVLEGEGHTVIEGQRFAFRAGDAFYTPPWAWHQHVAGDEGPVRYLTATNMPLLRAMGQTVLREEAGP